MRVLTTVPQPTGQIQQITSMTTTEDRLAPRLTPSTNFNGSNQLTTQSATYDGAGNQKTIGGYTFSYDAENRMTSGIVYSATATYAYDGVGNRVSRTMGGSTTTYVYDAANQLVAEHGNPTAPDTGTKYVSTDHFGIDTPGNGF
jgi:YD repeat-containing protein